MILLNLYFDRYRDAIVPLFASIVLLFVSVSISNATHVAGGNMTYKCLGNNEYEISFEFRRDCLNGAPGAQFDDPASIGVFDSAGNLITSIGNNGQLLIDFSATDTLNEVLTAECTMVNSDICIHRTTYRTTVFLPDRPGGYILAYQRCCRNFTLNNIVDPLTMGSTYWIHITEEALLLCNNSPLFNKWPDIYICSDDTLRFDHGATDADGDSLVFELCVPSTGASQDFPRPQPPNNPPYSTITWSPGYSLDDMMGGDPLTINAQTGELYAVPNTNGQYLIGICVKEFRDGVLLSEVRRDFEYNVRTCVESPMAIFEADFYQRCDRLDIIFTNMSSSDLAPIEEIDFTWYFDYPDNTLISTQQNPSIKFPEPGLYTVALVADDGTCIDTAFAEIGVSIPGDPTANFELNSTICEGVTEIQLQNTTLTIQDIIEYNWTIQANNQTYDLDGANPVLEIGNDQAIEVTLEVVTESGCRDTLTSSFDIVTDIIVDNVDIGPDQTICEGETVVLTAVGNFEEYLWNNGSVNQSITVTNEGFYAVTAIDSCGHSASDTMFLVVKPIEMAMLNYEICIDEFIEVNGEIYDIQGNYIQTLQSQFGCDSLLNIELTVHQPQTKEESYVYCLRHGIIVQGVFYDTTGQFSQAFIDEFGCEGTLVLNLEAESDCDYCGETLEVSQYLINVKKHEAGMLLVTIKLKEQILYKELVSQSAFESLAAEYSIQKELVHYDRAFVFNSYKSNINTEAWTYGGVISEKIILNYLNKNNLQDAPHDFRNISFTNNYILKGVEKLKVGNSFSFK